MRHEEQPENRQNYATEQTTHAPKPKKRSKLPLILGGIAVVLVIGYLFSEDDAATDPGDTVTNQTVTQTLTEEPTELSTAISTTSTIIEETTSTTTVVSTTEETTQGDTFELNEEVTLGDYVVKITSLEVVPAREGKNALKYVYDWTNNSDDTRSPFMTFSLKGYQNGIETDGLMIMAEGVDLGLGQKNVRPGTTVTAEGAVGIEDMNAPLELELKESFSFTGGPLLHMIEDLSELD